MRHYERQEPGELLHIDIKKLGRIGPMAPGTVCSARLGKRRANPNRSRRRTSSAGRLGAGAHRVDDATRLAYNEVLAENKAATAVGFLKRPPAFYRAQESPFRQ